MSLHFYMDVHVPLAITIELRMRGVDVLTAQEDGAAGMKDPARLDRAAALGRGLVTQDADFLREAARRHQQSISFHGIIYIPQLDVTIGRCITDLELCAKASAPVDWIGRVEYLPF